MAGIDRMVAYLGKRISQYRLRGQSRGHRSWRGDYGPGSHPQTKIYQALSAELVLAQQIKSVWEFAHHQKCCGYVLGAYYHFR